MVGGWSRGQFRARLGGGAIAVALVALACGGRTSMLDSDAFLEPGETTGGTSAGSGYNTSGSAQSGTTQGGSVNLPSAGTQNMPTPTGGTGSTPMPSPLLTVCQNYCNGYATECSQQFQPGQECVATCLSELGRVDSACQKTGIAALRCLTPFFSNGRLTCDQATANGLTKCNRQVSAFKVCSGEGGPTPTPEPQPSCPSMGEAGPGYCKTTYSCPTGPFTVSCQISNAGMSYDCFCYQPSGATQQYGAAAGVSDPCQTIASACGVPL